MSHVHMDMGHGHGHVHVHVPVHVRVHVHVHVHVHLPYTCASCSGDNLNLRPDFTFDISHTNKMLRAFCLAFCRKGPLYIRHLAKRFACKTFGPNVLHFPNEMQCKTFGAK